jgi:uncharacterized protein (TIGR00730 family)
MHIQNVAVFCGSRSGNNPQYEADAKQLGKALAETGRNLVYGGGNKGIMGAVANAALQNGGTVKGVIPRILLEWEVQHTSLTELIVTEDIHQRKKMMYELCDAAVILPGGYGTLDELFEMLTWNQLNIHSKKILILNTAGFFEHLYAHLEKMETEEFLYNHVEQRIVFCDTVDEVMKAIA